MGDVISEIVKLEKEKAATGGRKVTIPMINCPGSDFDRIGLSMTSTSSVKPSPQAVTQGNVTKRNQGHTHWLRVELNAIVSMGTRINGKSGHNGTLGVFGRIVVPRVVCIKL